MLTKVVEYYEESEETDPVVIKLTIGQATVLMGMRRAVLQGSAESWVALRRAEVLAANEDDAVEDDAVEGDAVEGDAAEVDAVEGDAAEVDAVDVRGNGHRPGFLNLMAGSLAARILYPDLLACVTVSEGLATDILTVDAFLALPERLTQAWEMAVYELNPHWLPGGAQSSTDEAAEKKG